MTPKKRLLEGFPGGPTTIRKETIITAKIMKVLQGKKKNVPERREKESLNGARFGGGREGPPRMGHARRGGERCRISRLSLELVGIEISFLNHKRPV